MKRLFTVLVSFILLHSFLSAQQIKLQPGEYSIRLPEGKTTFRVDETQVLVRLKGKPSHKAMSDFFASQGLFETFDQSWVLPFPDGVVARFSNRSDLSFTEKLSLLQQNELIEYSAPVLVYNEKIQQAVYDLFYVKVTDAGQLQQLQSMAKQLNFTVEKEYIDGIYFCRVNKNSLGNAFEIAKYIQSLSIFPFAEPDFVIWGKTNTNDPLYAQQWHLKNTAQFVGGVAGADLDIENAWTLTTGIPQIKVAILDCFGSIAQFTHPDFAFQAAYDATGAGFISTGYQGDAHGINCGGLIGATTNNTTGVAGVAYNAKLFAVKIGTIINSSGNWNATGNSISNGITWAYQNAHVISNSNNLGSSSSLVDNAIANSISIGRWGKGTPFLSSSGNDGLSTISYPASNVNTIAVGASTIDDTRASFSNYGTGLDIVAPGVSVYSTDIAGTLGYSTNDYFLFSGTSAACPVAAGVMALIFSLDSNLTHAQARTKIEQSCEKVGGYTYNSNVTGQPSGTWSTNNGYGRINAYTASLLAANSAPANDAIISASSMTLNAACNAVSGNLASATQSLPPSTCSGALATTAKDVWYSFVATQPNVSIYCKGGLRTDVVLGLYSGPSTSPVLLQCTDVAGMDATDVIHAANLSTGATYYIRVYDFNDNAYSTDFTLCVQITPVIATNIITGTQSVCGNVIPSLLDGSQPTNGAGFKLEGYKSYSDFPSINLPAGWSVPLTQDTLLRFTTSFNSFGRTPASGVILANNFNVQPGRRAQLQTNTFTSTISQDTLRFDVAHATYNSGSTDSLIVYAKVGASFVRVTGWGSAQTINTAGITTAPAQTALFNPVAAQWITKKLVLPLNSTQVRFEFYSGYGNQLYIDQVLLDSSVSSYSYKWIQSTTSATTGYTNAPGTNNTQTYAPGVLSQTTWFKRIVYSSGYADTSAAVTVTVNALPKAGYTINNPAQLLASNNFGFVDTSANVSTRLWNFGNSTTATSLNPFKTYAAAGIYTVKLRITTSSGCSDSISKNVKVYPNAPSVAGNSFSFQAITTTSMNVSWNNGNGQKRILVAKAGSAVNAIPANGVSYSANPQFGVDAQLGTANYVVLNNTTNSVSITNLQPNTTYYFALFEYNGDTSLSSYQQSGYLTGSNATLVPVTWVDFTATKLNSNVVLNWSTGSEKNNKGFEVQRSFNGRSFSKIGFVKGTGNSNLLNTYSYTDIDAFSASGELIYYRLQQIDFDGKYEYSPIRLIDGNLVAKPGAVLIYPNPNKGLFTVHLNEESFTQIGLYDVFGKLVKQLPAANSNVEVDARDLAKGLYFIKARSGDHTVQSKIVIE
ncbi:MAG: S8 family serine peptidase [Bacteroidota bacterium]